MGRYLRGLLAAGIVFQLLASPAYAWWKDKVAINERNAAEYIEKLKSGADPNGLRRPTMRFIDKYQAKLEQKKFKKAMDDAEALARAGRPGDIKELELHYQDLDKNPDKEKESGY